MKTALLKDGIKEVKNSYKRFISLLLIVLLGVGFFAGIKATSPDMRKTLDTYFDDLDVMDIQVISTLGLTEDDVSSIKQVENVENAEGSYQTDAIVTIGEEEVVVKLETITEELNHLNLVEGRMPENANECVVEPSFLAGTGHKVGDTIEINVEDITNDDGEQEKVLKNNQVTIVGTVESPIYIDTNRGSTTLGSGMIDYYLYVPKENLNAGIFTNVYLTVAGAKDLETNSDKYLEIIDAVENSLDAISEERREARYNELYDSANSKIEEAQKELDEEREKAEKELEDAQKEIDDGKAKIENGKAEIERNRANANYQFSLAEQELEDARAELEAGEKEFETEKKNAQEQIASYEEQLSLLRQTQKQLNNVQTNLKNAEEELAELHEKLENATDEEKAEIQEQIASKNVEIQTLQGTIAIIQSELEKQGITDLAGTITQLEEGISTANTKLDEAEKQLEDARAEIETGEKELQSQKNSTYYQLNQAEEEIEASEQELADGEKELEEARAEFDKQIKEAEDKLYEAKEDLKEIQRPEWYVLDREQNVGYVNYIQDTERVANLAEVFPVVFFLVAALMSLNSMARMVEEERVQIGTLKALGYSKRQIVRKYIVYAILATLIGGGLGLVIGFSYLPKVIADIYAMVYDVPDVILEFNVGYATAGMAAALLCTVGATVITSAKQLRQNPATLMRPKAPKPGKRVILEKIPFIWKHLNFTAKVTARNIFRYKQRFLMTIIGVCGCTSLIIAGFGLRDAIGNMIPMQYGEIYKYGINVSLKEEKEGEELKEIKEKILAQNEKVTDVLGANIQSVKIIKNDNNQSIQLVVPEDVNSIGTFISLRSRTNREESYVPDNNGVIITEKLAKLLDIKEGDRVTLENADGDRADVQVAHITENYILHYLYMSPELYNKVYDTRIESNTVLAKTEELSEEEENNLGKILLQDEENISGVSFTSDSSNMLETVMNNMDMVVWILIIAAGMLALVVLYNLLNANISERIRELATIKVLGFYDREVYEYIGRETIILTILGMLFGLIGGYYLTMYILKTCEIDMLMFDPEIRVLSYVLGIVITVVFAVIVNVITYFSLKKIDMIESLKSVE